MSKVTPKNLIREMEIIQKPECREIVSHSSPVSPERRRSRSRNPFRCRSDSKSANKNSRLRKRVKMTRRQSDVVMEDSLADIHSLRSDIEALKAQITCIEEDHMEISRLMESDGGNLSYLETTPVGE